MANETDKFELDPNKPIDLTGIPTRDGFVRLFARQDQHDRPHMVARLSFADAMLLAEALRSAALSAEVARRAESDRLEHALPKSLAAVAPPKEEVQ